MTNHVSRFTFHVSRFTFHVSRFTLHASRFTLPVLVGAWALALYIHIWRLPFFRDDMVMLLWLRDMPWGRLWIDATGFPYYRPLSFATLKLSELFFGYYQPQFLHAVNLFFHTANSIMIALLTQTIFNKRGGAAAGLCAGLLYAAYPFTFEVMPTTGPIFQLQAAFFALAATLAYVRWRHSTFNVQRLTFNRWLYLSWTMALLGSFTCEYSVIIPPMIIATEIVLRRQSEEQGTRNQEPGTCPLVPLSPCPLVPLSYFAFTALYLIIWSLVPKTRSTLPWLWLHDLGYKTLYYLQGLTYPLQPLALPLARWLGLTPLTEYAGLSGEWAWPAVTVLAAITIVSWLVLFARRRRLDLLLYGLAWWAIAVAPMWPTLDWDYTWNGPRLHYIPALGAALIWGSAIALLNTDLHGFNGFARITSKISAPIWSLASLGVFLVALVPSVVFLRAQADVVLTGGQIVDEIVETVVSIHPDESALVVNFPSWISPARQMYAIGAEGITFLPGYSTIDEMVEINSRQKRSVTSATLTNVWKAWKFNQRFYTPALGWEHLAPLLRATPRIFQVQYSRGKLALREAGSVQTTPGAAGAAIFGDKVRLQTAWCLRSDPAPFPAEETSGNCAFSPQWEKAAEKDLLFVTIDWTAQEPLAADWTIFLHVYDHAGSLVAQGDGDPMLGLYPLWLWRPGERVRDMRYIELPPDLPRGRYTVGVGIFDRVNGARIAARSADGQHLANDTAALFEFEK